MRPWAWLALVALVCASGGHVTAAGGPVRVERVRLAPGESRRMTLDQPVVTRGGRRLLFVTGRLTMPRGEAWGTHALRIEREGEVLAAAAGPLNKPPMLSDAAFPDRPAVPWYDPRSEAWFVRYDSDWAPYNATDPGDPYNRTGYCSYANIGANKRNFHDTHYLNVFELGTPESNGVILITFSNLSPRHAMALVVAMTSADTTCLFASPPGAAILPWTFPRAGEIGAPLRARAAPGLVAPLMLSCCNLGESDLDFQLAAGPLRSGKSEIGADLIELRAVTYQPCANPRGQAFRPEVSGEPSLPDRLTVSDRLAVPARRTASHWITVHLPSEQPPGLYRGTLTLRRQAAAPLAYPIEIEVLPLRLEESRITFGLWDNKVTWPPDALAELRMADLKAHGINALLMDPWTAPVRVSRAPSGALKVDTRPLEEMLQYRAAHGLRSDAVPYGILSPLVSRVAELTGAQPGEEAFEPVFAEVVGAIQRVAEAHGVDLYFHPTDEPDLHPDRMPTYGILRGIIRRAGGRVWSNNTLAGARHLADELDINTTILSTLTPSFSGRGYTNPFFREWGETSAAWAGERYGAMFVQTQVRGSQPLSARLHYGILPAWTGVRGVWGFCYHWNDDWYVGWPFPEEAGERLGSTVGWEMIREGTYDCRYAQALLASGEAAPGSVRAAERLAGLAPPPARFAELDMEDLADARERVLDALLGLQPRAPAWWSTPRPNEGEPAASADPNTMATALTGNGASVHDGVETTMLKIETYAISPGNYHAPFGAAYDRDLLDPSDPARGRRGLLTYGPPTAGPSVVYAFWRVPEEEAFLTVECDLGATRQVGAVRVAGYNSTGMYAARAVVVYTSEDQLSWERSGEARIVDGDRHGAWMARVEIKPRTAARYVRSAVFAREDRWLGLVRIEIEGTGE